VDAQVVASAHTMALTNMASPGALAKRAAARS